MAQLGLNVLASSNSGNAFAHFVGPVSSCSVTLFDTIDPIAGSGGPSIDVFTMTFVGCEGLAERRFWRRAGRRTSM